jgi:hypothetical protein
MEKLMKPGEGGRKMNRKYEPDDDDLEREDEPEEVEDYTREDSIWEELRIDEYIERQQLRRKGGKS